MMKFPQLRSALLFMAMFISVFSARATNAQSTPAPAASTANLDNTPNIVPTEDSHAEVQDPLWTFLQPLIPNGNVILSFALILLLIALYRGEFRILLTNIAKLKFTKDGLEIEVKNTASETITATQTDAAPVPLKNSNAPRPPSYGDSSILKSDIYLDHDCFPTERKNCYLIDVYLNAEFTSLIDKVESVTYRLHPSFPNPTRPVTVRGDDLNRPFLLKGILAFGEFCVLADVLLKPIQPEGRSETIELSRYLSFSYRLSRTPPYPGSPR